MRGPEHSRAWAVLLVAFALLCGGIGGCGGTGEPAELETIDVPPAIEIDTSQDTQAADPETRLVGVLPGSFPADLPLYLPASLVDFGDAEQGRRSVTLLSPHRPSRVRRELHDLLGRNGWTPRAGVEADHMVLRKGERRAWLFLDNASGGTRYRYEYYR